MPLRSRSNLRAVKRLARTAGADTAAHPAAEAVLVLAETLAAAVDDAVGGGQPGYVLSRLCSSYAGVLELASQLVSSMRPGDPFEAFLQSLALPGEGAFKEGAFD